MLTLTLTGETPAKKNSKIWTRSGKLIPSAKYKAWHDVAVILIRTQAGRIYTIDEELKITMTFYHGDQRKRDSDNQASSILDTLMDAEVIADDKWQIVRELSIKNFYDKANPRAVITIEPYKKTIEEDTTT